MEHKAQYQLAGDEQIVARFMIEQLHFRGITDAVAAATCLASYDLSRYPEESGATYTGFFYPQAHGAGLRLEHSAAALWNAFVHDHAAAQLHVEAEIPMDYFTRALESVLINGPDWALSRASSSSGGRSLAPRTGEGPPDSSPNTSLQAVAVQLLLALAAAIYRQGE